MSKGLSVLGRLSAGAVIAASFALPAAAQDIVKVGDVTGVKGTRVNIPIQIKDNAATVLGVDQAVTTNVSGRIAGISITVDYPATLGSIATAYDSGAFPVTASGAATGIVTFSPPTVLTNAGVFPNRFTYQVIYDSNGMGGPQIPFNQASPTPETIAVVPFLIPAGTPNGPYVFTVNAGGTSLTSRDATVEEISPANLALATGTITVTPVELQAFDAE